MPERTFSQPPRAEESTTAVATTEMLPVQQHIADTPEEPNSLADMKIPVLKIGQRTGNATDEHPEWVGKWIYDDGAYVNDKVSAITLQATKFYQEDVEFDSGIIPEKWYSQAAAQASGKPHVVCAELFLMIEAPEGYDQVIEMGGKGFVLARVYVRKKAFTDSFGVINTDRRLGWLKGDWSAGWYQWSTYKVPGKNPYYVPKLKAAGKVDEALRTEIREKLGV